MKKYTWEEIKKENGIYKTFCEEGYSAIGSQFGDFNFHSKDGEITVLNLKGEKEINTDSCWNDEIFVELIIVEV